MPSHPEPRYHRIDLIADHPNRSSSRSQDRLTGRSVFVKSGARRDVVDECLALLSLPPSVTPDCIDLVPDTDGVSLVLPWMEGETLAQRLSRLGPLDDGALLYDLAGTLGSLHRRGFVHVDLKPGNVFLESCLSIPEGASVSPRDRLRLIDFGMAKTPFFRLANSDLGGTRPYVAPEVERGWSVGPAADVHAFGRIVALGFSPWVDRQGLQDWVSQLCSSKARERPSMAEVLRVIAQHETDLPESDFHRSELGGGRLYGRARQLEFAAKSIAAAQSARLLIHARPGTGLTRFLLELLVYMDQKNERMPRLIECPTRGDWNPQVATDLLAHAERQGRPVLAFVSDPSPGLHELEFSRREWVEREFPREQRLHLRPVGPEAFVSSMVDTLGEGGASVDKLGEAIWTETEGDWWAARRIFSDSASSRATGGRAGRIPNEREEIQSVALSPILPAEESLRNVLSLCALVGRRFPRSLGERLIDSGRSEGYGPPEPDSADRTDASIARLVDRGYLWLSDDDLLEFPTRKLFAEAKSQTENWGDRRLAVLRLIHAMDTDTAADVERCLEACRRAHVLDDLRGERETFRLGLESRLNEGDWRSVLELLSYPSSETVDWTEDQTPEVLDSLAARFGFEPEFLYNAAADALKQSRPNVATKLWDSVARMSDSADAVNAISRILNLDPRPESFDRYADRLAELESHGFRPRAGELDLWRANAMLRQGAAKEARECLDRALPLMEADGGRFLDIAYLQKAILDARPDDEAFVGLLDEAMKHAPTPPRKMIICCNAALMFGHRWQAERVVEICEYGLSLDAGVGTQLSRHILQQNLAWGLYGLDRVHESFRSARALERFESDTHQPESSRGLLGLCASYLGDFTTGIRALREGYDVALSANHVESSTALLSNLLSVMVDADRMELAAGVPRLRNTSTPKAELVNARLAAVREMGHERWDVALSGLESVMPLVPHLTPPDKLGLFHQAAWVRLAIGRSSKDVDVLLEASRGFNDALRCLPDSGYTYFRLRSEIGRAECTALLGDVDNGSRCLSASIESARELECQAAVVLGLRTRSRVERLLSNGFRTGRRTDS